MTEAGNQAVLNQELYRLLFTDSTPGALQLTLGEAVRRAKAAVNDHDLRRTGILLGDPSMPLRVR
jgi:hypothetical protein